MIESLIQIKLSFVIFSGELWEEKGSVAMVENHSCPLRHKYTKSNMLIVI